MSESETHFFRHQAIKSQLTSDQGEGTIRICPPWVGILFCTMVCVVLTGVVLAFLCSVEVTARGPGIIRPQGGVRTLETQSEGTVERVTVHSGERVFSGEPILSVEAAVLRSQTFVADAELAGAKRDIPELESRQKAALELEAAHSISKADLLRGEIASQEASTRSYEHKAEVAQQLQADGIVSQADADSAQELVAQARRQLSGLQESLEQNAQDLIALRKSEDQFDWQYQQSIRSSETKRTALNSLGKQTSVLAPVSGVVEALLVKPGDILQDHQVVGKIVPDHTVLQVVAFLGERDRAFVKPGDAVRLELNEIPYDQYGSLGGKVLRISDDLASAYEVQQALGDTATLPEPAFWVDLAITDSRAASQAKVELRSGMLLNARYTLRRNRLITLIFPSLQRLFR